MLANIDIGETVAGMIRLLQRPLGEDIVLEARFAPLLPQVRALLQKLCSVVDLAANIRACLDG